MAEAERTMKVETEKAGKDLLALFRAEKDASLRGMQQFVLSLVNDTYVPVDMFKPWASARRFREWRDHPDHKLDVRIIHDRSCVRPTDFFALWARLPAKSRRSKHSPAGHDAGTTPSSLGGRVGGNSRVRPKRRAAGAISP